MKKILRRPLDKTLRFIYELDESGTFTQCDLSEKGLLCEEIEIATLSLAEQIERARQNQEFQNTIDFMTFARALEPFKHPSAERANVPAITLSANPESQAYINERVSQTVALVLNNISISQNIPDVSMIDHHWPAFAAHLHITEIDSDRILVKVKTNGPALEQEFLLEDLNLWAADATLLLEGPDNTNEQRIAYLQVLMAVQSEVFWFAPEN
jgi:hypothetical protein